MIQNQIQAQIDFIKRQLVEYLQPEKIILFGSAVSNKMTVDSDLDFLIIKDDKRNFHDRVVAVYKLIEKKIAADFIVYTPQEVKKRIDMGDPFIKSVLAKGKVLYG